MQLNFASFHFRQTELSLLPHRTYHRIINTLTRRYLWRFLTQLPTQHNMVKRGFDYLNLENWKEILPSPWTHSLVLHYQPKNFFLMSILNIPGHRPWLLHLVIRWLDEDTNLLSPADHALPSVATKRFALLPARTPSGLGYDSYSSPAQTVRIPLLTQEQSLRP